MMRPHRRKVTALIRRIQNVFEWLPKDHPKFEFLDGVYFGLVRSQGYTYGNYIERVLKEVEASHENKSQG